MAQKIAIIEDDQAISQMYRIKFEAEGYTVETAENGKVGLELVNSMKPDIILLDLMMPEMTGDEMLKELRKTDLGKNIKVVVLTNISKDEIPADMHGLNVNRYIVKAHHTPQEVTKIIKSVLSL